MAMGSLLNAQSSERQLKLAQTGYQFLSIGTHARTGALAGSGTAMNLGSIALDFNPAGLAFMDSWFDITMSRNSWIASITHQSLTGALRPWGGRLGVIGFSFMNVDYGEFYGTTVWPNEQGYLDTGPFYPTALVAGIGYARGLTDRFAAGGQVKLAAQYLGEALWATEDDLVVEKHTSNVLAYDFGTYYHTPYKSLVFAMSVRNFSKEVTFAQESFQLPLTFTIGASMNLYDFLGPEQEGRMLRLSLDASHPRSHPEIVNLGVEYIVMERLSLRMGYKSSSDEESLAAGFGVQIAGVSFDYAFTPTEHFNSVQRISLGFNQ